MASARPKTDFDDKRSRDNASNGNGSGENSQKNKNQNQQNQKAARRKQNQNRKGVRLGSLGGEPHLPERAEVKMPEPSPPNEGTLNTPPPAKIEKLSVGIEQEADSTNENFFTANNSVTSFSQAKDEDSSVTTTPRFQARDPESDDRNGNFVFGSPTLQNDSFKFTAESSALETSSAAKPEEDENSEDDDGNENVTHASLLVNLSESTAAPFNFQSFTTSASNNSTLSGSGASSDSYTSLSSTKSAPPNMTSIGDELSDDDFPTLNGPSTTYSPAPLQTSTPFPSGEEPKVNLDLSTTPLTTYPRKKNSVSFAEMENIIPAPDTTKYEDEESNDSSEEEDSQAIPISASDSESAPLRAAVEKRNLEAEQMKPANPEPVFETRPFDVNARIELELAPGDAEADEEVEEINSFLPATVTELIANNGVKVYVVGTAHFSKQSHEDVIQTIQKVQPSLVVLELCHARRNILTLDEETILKEAANLNLDKMRSAIRQSGAIRGGLHLLLLSMSASLTKQLGMAPGGEFRVAVQEAQKIPGCMLLLGDRGFDVTLSRALSSLSFPQKLKMGWQFLTSSDKITKEEVEALKEKDLLEKMLCDMSGEFPSMSRVFVEERDMYLSHSLWLAAVSDAPRRGDCGMNHGPIVGVVGMGHVPGIVKHWGKVTQEDVAEIVKIPEPTLTSIVVGKTLKFSFYLLLTYGAYKCSKRLFNFPSEQFVQATVDRVGPPIKSLSDKLLSKRF